jgi:hypothetical protein
MVLQSHPNIIKFNTIYDVDESLMNPLKEIRTASTIKAIITLFICSSLLIGLATISFNQAAFAQQAGPPEGRGPPEEEDTTSEEATAAPVEATAAPEEDTLLL